MDQGVAFITGAGSGMGQMFARRLLAAGWRVAAVDIDPRGLAGLGTRPELLTLEVDVRNWQAVCEAVARTEAQLGPITRVVSAAAIMPLGPLLEMAPEVMRRIVDVNYLGLVHVSKATMPAMLQRRSGEFVSFASLAGHIPIFYMGAYSASKAATVAYTEVLEQESRGAGVRVVCVCPPAVNTPLLDQGRATRWPRLLDLFPIITPESVLDAVERSLRRGRFWAFPGWYSRLSLAVRRLAPGFLWWFVRLVERPGR